MTVRTQRYATPRNYLTMAAVISLLVVAIGVVTAYLFSSSLSTQTELERTNLLSQQSSGFTTYIQERAANYEQVLLSAAGLIKVHNLDNITATDWTTLITSLQLRRLHPELLSMGLVKGTVLTYAEVFEEGRPANLGYDFASEPIRLQTIELARDNAQTTVTPPVVLRTDAQSANDTAPYSLIFFYPIYRTIEIPSTLEDRRAAISGYVYVSVRLQDMMKARQNVLDDTEAIFRLNDVSASNAPVLYQYQASGHRPLVGDSGLSANFSIFNRQWRSEMRLSRPTEQSILGPLGVFLLGAATSMGIGGLIFWLLVRRLQRLHLSHEADIQRTKDELLALASHQLRTPATGVRQYLSMLQLGYFGRLPRDQLEVLVKAQSANDRQLEIIDQLLYVAKADADQNLTDPESLDLVGLARRVMEDQSATAGEKQIEVKLIAPKKVTCVVDARFTHMILENLLSNAIKYSQPGSPVEIRVQPTQNDVSITITDQGVGIAESDLPKLFAKFTRLDNPLSRTEGGSGLGLFLAESLAAAQGGRLEVMSTLGQGSAFKLILPLPVMSNRNVTGLTD